MNKQKKKLEFFFSASKQMTPQTKYLTTKKKLQLLHEYESTNAKKVCNRET